MRLRQRLLPRGPLRQPLPLGLCDRPKAGRPAEIEPQVWQKLATLVVNIKTGALRRFRRFRRHTCAAGFPRAAGNSRMLELLRYWLRRDWFKWLRRRSGAAARQNWEWMEGLLRRFPLPPPRIHHSALPRIAKP